MAIYLKHWHMFILIVSNISNLYVSLSLEGVDKPAGARVMLRALSALIQLSLDLLRQGLAKFNTPLIEAVNVPHSALGERAVLIVCNQGT